MFMSLARSAGRKEERKEENGESFFAKRQRKRERERRERVQFVVRLETDGLKLVAASITKIGVETNLHPHPWM